MKIAIIAPFLPPEFLGGTERVAVAQAQVAAVARNGQPAVRIGEGPEALVRH